MFKYFETQVLALVREEIVLLGYDRIQLPDGDFSFTYGVYWLSILKNVIFYKIFIDGMLTQELMVVSFCTMA